MNLKNIKTLTIALAALSITAADAQTYRLPGQHNQQSADLLANQDNSNQIVLSVANYLDFEEEEAPEEDIYTEGWNSRYVNCYQNASVPQTATIDVSKFCMPVPGYLTSPYGYRKRFKRQHKGVDLKLNIGDTVRAAFDGRVRLTKFEAKGYGNYIVARHTNDLETVYGHLSKFLVNEGDYVKAGDPIALGGNTGRSTGPHLHFETRYMGYPINPSAIFDFANQTTHTDTYTFDKRTYQNARNFDPQANADYAAAYMKAHPNKYNNTSSNSSSKKSGKKTYTVKKGDSLAKIAAANGITLAKLTKLNGLKASSKISPGQKLRVK
mgnify:CR=1 FL=1